MSYLHVRSIWSYALIAVALLLAGIAAIGIAGTVSAQVVSAPVQVSGGGGFVQSTPFVSSGYTSGVWGPNQMVCYKNGPYEPLVCYNNPPNTVIVSGGGVYRTPYGGVVSTPVQTGGGVQYAPVRTGGGTQYAPVFV